MINSISTNFYGYQNKMAQKPAAVAFSGGKLPRTVGTDKFISQNYDTLDDIGKSLDYDRFRVETHRIEKMRKKGIDDTDVVIKRNASAEKIVPQG